MRIPNIGFNAPARFSELWDWIAALDAWDYCDPEPLEKMIHREPIPEELRKAICDIISGRRQQKRKAAAKSKVPAAKRMHLAHLFSVVSGMRERIVSDPEMLDRFAEREGTEPREFIQIFDKTAKFVRRHMAETEYGISDETVENLVRDVRQKIRDWPDV